MVHGVINVISVSQYPIRWLHTHTHSVTLQHSALRGTHSNCLQSLTDPIIFVGLKLRHKLFLLHDEVNSFSHILHNVTWLYQSRVESKVSVAVEHSLFNAMVSV